MKAYLIVESGLAVPIFATNRNKALKKLYDSGYEAQGITSGEPTVIRKPEWTSTRIPKEYRHMTWYRQDYVLAVQSVTMILIRVKIATTMLNTMAKIYALAVPNNNFARTASTWPVTRSYVKYVKLVGET